jgi:hypothetical protein
MMDGWFEGGNLEIAYLYILPSRGGIISCMLSPFSDRQRYISASLSAGQEITSYRSNVRHLKLTEMPIRVPRELHKSRGLP